MKDSIDSGSGYAKFQSAKLRKLLQYPLVAVGLHWTFQSLLYMDKTERWFKIALDAGLTIIGTLLLSTWTSAWVSLLIAFLFAHTINFLFNGHLWGALKHYGYTHIEKDAFVEYEQQIEHRLHSEPSIILAVACGSMTRDEWKPSSDLDMRLVRKHGFLNGIKACSFVMKERTRALFSIFPLDLYVLDSLDSLSQISPDDFPQVLHDRR